MKTPPQTPDEAMSFVKSFVRTIAPPGFIDEHAFRLIGEPPERVEQILNDLRHEVADGMASCNPQPSQSKIFAMPLAFCELVRERAIELSNGRGNG